MLDLAYIRANSKEALRRIGPRGPEAVNDLKLVLMLDEERREAITISEQLRAKRNELSKLVAEWTRSGLDATSLMAENRALKQRLEDIDEGSEFDQKVRKVLSGIPNFTQDWVESPDPDFPSKSKGVRPGRSEEDNLTVKTWRPGMSEEDSLNVKTWGEKPSFTFTPKPHWELGEELGILDLERAAKITGARFAVYMGQGARLERALINFMLDLHTSKHGYKEVLPPFMVNSKSLFGTGNLPKFAGDLFRCADAFIEGDSVLKHVKDWDPDAAESLAKFNDHWLIPTAEVPVTNLYRDEILDEARLPICFTAYTPCFRAEAGAAGKDTRGIIRQHQFQKVELVKFTRPADSDAEHERLTRDAEEILEALELPYRRVLLCAGDTSFSSAKTFDLEVWLPGQGLYREISSCSNFEAFQARRANIRYRPSGEKGAKAKPEFVHTINGSGLAVGRTWLAILENYQQADGSVTIPQALRPYMGGLDRIVKEL
jgi:seryl-tRNA synthetase